MTMLFVESGLWTRYSPTQQGITRQVHVQGPEQGDAVIVTSEAVIAAVLGRRLSMRQAIARGLITFDGPANAARARMTLIKGRLNCDGRTGDRQPSVKRALNAYRSPRKSKHLTPTRTRSRNVRLYTKEAS